ncbi:hypothetical protein [Saccharibacillus sp. JS10]|uniref:hypothetical protein n=1 Tax=Saccharibacillus sp. JS10 TaxID=2950552 RepID=UPI00210EB2A9|nr:hypothetical protein [Saccharibacillus sp. JS10]MCQ4085601.1 hypothetical protein [Saccharibacillus sp. JS10]
MKTAIFIGDRDKTDLLFYTAKTLAQANLKVLIVDATTLSTYEFSYPALEVSGEPHEYDTFDVWRMSEHSHSDLLTAYDVVLYDTDDLEQVNKIPDVDYRFLVVGCEQTSIRRNVRLLDQFFATRPMSELYAFRKIWIEGSQEPGEDYISEQFEVFPIDWKETFVYYPDERDVAVKINNQYANTLKLKKLSTDLKKTVQGIVATLLEQDLRETKKLWKKAERS